MGVHEHNARSKSDRLIEAMERLADEIGQLRCLCELKSASIADVQVQMQETIARTVADDAQRGFTAKAFIAS